MNGNGQILIEYLPMQKTRKTLSQKDHSVVSQIKDLKTHLYKIDKNLDFIKYLIRDSTENSRFIKIEKELSDIKSDVIDTRKEFSNLFFRMKNIEKRFNKSYSYIIGRLNLLEKYVFSHENEDLEENEGKKTA